MRKYYNDSKILLQVACDKCGRNMIVENGIIKEGIFSIDYKWGYFSDKDGVTHSIDICEECYDKLIKDNDIKITKKDDTEFI